MNKFKVGDLVITPGAVVLPIVDSAPGEDFYQPGEGQRWYHGDDLTLAVNEQGATASVEPAIGPEHLLRATQLPGGAWTIEGSCFDAHVTRREWYEMTFGEGLSCGQSTAEEIARRWNAAPDLFDALAGLLDCTDESAAYDPVIKAARFAARAALAKAGRVA